MFKELKKRQEGFTIIEVMIVLVIAAVILLIVFLAVPALQRNSRNTQIKNEAAQMLSAASEWSSNNNGKTPAASSSTGTTFSGTTDADGIGKLTKNKTLVKLTVTATAPTAPPAADTAILVTSRACDTAASSTNAYGTGNDGTPTKGGSTRQVALLYTAETGSGGAKFVTCTEGGL